MGLSEDGTRRSTSILVARFEGCKDHHNNYLVAHADSQKECNGLGQDINGMIQVTMMHDSEFITRSTKVNDVVAKHFHTADD